MEAISLPIYNTEGKEVDSINLDKDVFDGVIHSASLYQAVLAYRANQRRGLASTKTRGEVSGGGNKPWRQKGTGRARVGSNRSPLWRHGGVIFGPHPRSFSCKIPKKLKELALKSSLNAKIKENNFVVINEFNIDSPKTKQAAKIFSNEIFRNQDKKKKQSPRNILLLLDKSDKNIKLALRNIRFLEFDLAQNIHAYNVIASKKLLITKAALNSLTKRLKK